MSMRPIDMQVVLPKSGEIAKLNNNLLARSDEQQQMFSEHMQRQVEAEQQQVLESGKSEEVTVDKDGENRNRGKYKGKKDPNKKKDFKEKKIKDSTSMYDIKI